MYGGGADYIHQEHAPEFASNYMYVFRLCFLYRKELRLKFLLIIILLSSTGLAFIFATGMQDIWVGRMSNLAEVRESEENSFSKIDPSVAMSAVSTAATETNDFIAPSILDESSATKANGTITHA
ncbi:hypothetical protein IMF27_14895 [Pseudomonas sp. PCH199]|uniref:hypothetical protein n=1 Tax=unclassified Pseudomonas TaxID=196821 RepID=UPI000BD2E0C1|nr:MULTISPECIES: hypothetical protein [unclassified Pseudomonas]MCW8276803.1 hypothetical protein [Pseudomonas sp. PCH199]PAM83084.1 hypothetical protein CES87_15200 [Pseudomonas sp. ERMR1:02]